MVREGGIEWVKLKAIWMKEFWFVFIMVQMVSG